MIAILVMASLSIRNRLSQAFYQKLEPLDFFIVGLFCNPYLICMLLWNWINLISQHSTPTSMHINELQRTSQPAFIVVLELMVSSFRLAKLLIRSLFTSCVKKLWGNANDCDTKIVSSSRMLFSDMLGYINSKRLCYIYCMCGNFHSM